MCSQPGRMELRKCAAVGEAAQGRAQPPLPPYAPPAA
eukprot:gene5443-3315_t